MESSEAEKAAILAELEESAGLGKERYLKFGTYHDLSFGSKVMNYSRNFGFDYLYRPSLPAELLSTPKAFPDYENDEANSIQYFLSILDNFDEIIWFDFGEEELDTGDVLSREKLSAIKMENSPFEDIRESARRDGFTIAQTLDSVNVVKSFAKLSKRKASRKDRKRERRDSESMDSGSLPGSAVKLRKEKVAFQQGLPIEQKLALERIAISTAKVVVDGDLASVLAVLSLAVNLMQGVSFNSWESYLVPVGNMMAMLFDTSTTKTKMRSESHHSTNPFKLHANHQNPPSKGKYFAGDFLSKAQMHRFDDTAHGHGPGTSDAGSTIGSTFGEIGTDTASVMDDDMNEEDMLARALALSVGNELHASSFPIGGESSTKNATDVENTTQLDAFNLELSGVINGSAGITFPFSAAAPFNCKEFVFSIYGGDVSRITNNLVPIQSVIVALLVVVNLSLESKLTSSEYVASNFSGGGHKSSVNSRLQLSIVSSLESIACLEFLVSTVKTLISAHIADSPKPPMGDDVNVTEKTMKWHLHMYILTWSLQSLLRLSSELTSKASMRTIRSQSSSNSNTMQQVKRSVSRLRDEIVDLLGLVNNIVKPALSTTVTGKLDITKYLEVSFPVNLQLADVSSSMFGASSHDETVVLDYHFSPWNISHNLRLTAIDSFLSLFHVVTPDPVSRQDLLLQLIGSATMDSEHLLLHSLQSLFLCDLQHALSNGEVIYMKEYNVTCPEDLYVNYFLQRCCIEVLKADDHLLPYFHVLTTGEKLTTTNSWEFDLDERYTASLQKLMKLILSRLDKRALSSNFYGVKEDHSAGGRLWGELDFIRCAQNFVCDKIDRDLELYWNQKGLIYQEFQENRSHPNIVFSDDMKVATHIGAKSWCSTIASNGFEANSGVYEWTIKIDHCSKGHLFVGICTNEITCEKDGYIGVDKQSWGLIGTRSLWHARGKVRSDYGTGFNSGSMITTIYDSDNHTVSFRCDGHDWGVAFENIPKVKIFPAFSLHEKDDQISILRCIRHDNVTISSKTRGNSLDVRADSWPGFFADYCQTVLGMSDRTVSSSLSIGEERILLSPIVTILSASLLAYTQSPKFSYLADSPIIVSILPYLTVYSRRLANLSDKLGSRKSNTVPSTQSFAGTCFHKKNGSLCMYGDWQVRIPSVISNSPFSMRSQSYQQHQWKLSPLSHKPPSDEEEDDDDGNTDEKYLNFLSGDYLSFDATSSDGVSSAIAGIQEKAKFKLSLKDKNGNLVVTNGRLSLCGRYFYATRLESGRLGRCEGYMANLDPRFANIVEAQIIKRLAFLAFSSCSLLAGKLVGDSISSDRFRDLEMEDTSAADDAEFSLSTAMDTDEAQKESEEGDNIRAKNWTDSVLFSGGLSLTARNLDAVMRFLAAYLSKYCPNVRELILQKSAEDEEGNRKENQRKIEDYLASWLDIVLPLKSDVGEDVSNSSLSLSEMDVSIGTDEAQFYSSLLEGKGSAAALDEYLCLFVGQSAVLKIGGAIMARTRRMIIVSLIQHSGCFRVCEAEMQALLTGDKTISDKPVTVLLEIWRAGIRVIENIIRIKQETGDSYDHICRSVCRKAEFLSQIDPSKACSSINSTFMFMEKSHLVSDRWYLEAGVRVHVVVSKLIAETTEFFTSTSSMTNVDAFHGKLIERTADAFLRIAGFKSYLYLLGKVDREWQKLPLFSTCGPGLHHEYHTMGLSHLPVFRQNAVVMNAQQHYGSGLRGVCQKVKTTLQYSFEQLYELITQHLTKSTWAKDRDGQFAALKAWNILIQPDDHLLLNRLNLFRTLHTVLDDVRSCIENREDNNASNQDNMDDADAEMLQMCFDENTHRDQIEFVVAAKRELSLGQHTALAQLVLDTVYSLAAQIAGASENVADDFDLGAAHLLRRTSSGPDTLSRSLFDLMFSEYLSSVKPIMITNLSQNTTATDNNIASSITDVSEESKTPTVMKLIEGENYLYRILNLLKMVAQSKNCLKLLQSTKWTTALVSAVGFGNAVVQRRIFRLLRILLTTTNPRELHVCVPKFFESRPILRLDVTSDTDEFISTCTLEDGDNINSLGLEIGQDADAMLCFLLECIGLLLPEEQRNNESDPEDCNKNLSKTWLDGNSKLGVVVGYEAMALMRVLMGIPAWRLIASQRFNSILGSGESSKLAKLAVYYALGGAFEQKRVGGVVNLRPFSLLSSSDQANRGSALSFSRGVIASLSSNVPAEVVLVHQGLKVQRINGSNNSIDPQQLRISHYIEVPKSSSVRCVKVPVSDIVPTTEVPVLSFMFADDLVQNLFKYANDKLGWAESNLLLETNETSSNAVEGGRIAIVGVVSIMKLVSIIVQNEVNVQYLLTNHFQLFSQMLRICNMTAGNLGLASLEAADCLFGELLAKTSTTTRSRPPSTAPNAPDEEVDIARRQPSNSSGGGNMRSRWFGSSRSESNSNTNNTTAAPAAASSSEAPTQQLRDLASLLSPFSMALRGVDPAMQSAALNQMLEIGLPREWCEFSLRRCHYNVEMAINMCLEHGDEMPQLIAQEAEAQAARQRQQEQAARAAPSLRQARTGQSQTTQANRPDATNLFRHLIEMGFPPSFVSRALEAGQSGNAEDALGWVLSRDAAGAPQHLGGEEEDEEEGDESEQSDEDISFQDALEERRGRGSRRSAFINDSKRNEDEEDEEDDEEPKVSPLQLVSGNAILSKDLTCGTQGGGFPSVGCKDFPVSQGKWYYEVKVISAGCVQVGWATTSYKGDADGGQGVGDDSESWAYDGWRSYLWHVVSAKWGARWKAGDTVGCAIDLDARTMSFYLNGLGEEIGMGLAVDFSHENRNISVFPCVSFNRNESVKFNFGDTPFIGRIPNGYLPYSEAIKASSKTGLPNSKPTSWVMRWKGVQEEKNAVVKIRRSSYVPGERSTTKMLKRYFRQDESKLVGPETTDFFSVESEKDNEVTDQLTLTGRRLVILFCRLIVLRCLKTLPRLETSSKNSIVGAMDTPDNRVLLDIIHLLQLTSLHSNRTKTYHLLHTMQSCTSVDMGNLGSVFCAGGQPALFELQNTVEEFALHSLESNNFGFVREGIKCIGSNLLSIIQSCKNNEHRWSTEVCYIPVVVRDRSADEKHWKRTPSLIMAHTLTSVLVSSCFKVLSKSNSKALSDEVLSFVEEIMSLWCNALNCSVDAICLVAIKTLSYITQDMIIFLKDHSMQGNLVMNPQLLQSIRSTCIQLLDSERLSQPVLSEYNNGLLELAGAVSFIHESFCGLESEKENHSVQSNEVFSALSEMPEDEHCFDHCWEERTGRLLSSDGNWITWTGSVTFQSFALPGSTSFSKWKERQEFPPELLPGCKVTKSTSKPSLGSRLDEDLRELMESDRSPGDSSFPFSRFRMMLERTASGAGENNSNDEKMSPTSNNETPVLGTVVEVVTWPGTNVLGNARRIKWDADDSTEVVRWGAEDAFDVVHCAVNGDGKIVQKYANPPTFWQKLHAAGFGQQITTSIILRLRELPHSNSVVSIVEWPQFAATVFCRGEKSVDGEISLTEERLLSGPSHAGWETRFGYPRWQKGAKYSLRWTQTNSQTNSLVGSIQNDALILGHSFSVVADVDLQDAMLFSFDKELHAPNVVVSLDASSVSKPSGGGQGCAIGNVGFSSGVHYWEFKIEQGEIGSIFVGVIEKPEDMRTLPRQLSRWQGLGMVNNRSSYHTGHVAFGERINVYGDHFQSGDLIGVVLDLNRGTLSFFLDGLKYGEHIMADLGVAHEGLHVSSTSINPRTFFPIVGVSKSMDRVTITKRWLSTPGFDSSECFKLYERAFQLLYSWNLERASAPLRQHMWIYREGWRHYNRWQKNEYYRCRMRVNIGSVTLALNKTVRSCVEASINLGLSHPLFHGDRIVFTKTSGRSLDTKEEAVILGSYKGLLWYKLDSHDVTTEEVIETGADVWFLVPNDVEGMSLLKRGLCQVPSVGIETPLPRIPLFHGGFVHVFHENGAVMRDGIEIDTSDILCSVPTNTTVYAIERRMNSSNIMRYLVFYNGHYGWISERMRGGTEDTMVRRVEATDPDVEDVDEVRSNIANHCKNIYVLNRLYQKEVSSMEEAMMQWDALISSASSTSAAVGVAEASASKNGFISFEEYLALSSTMDGTHAWSVEADMQLCELISKLAFQKNKQPMNLTMQDIRSGLASVRDNPSHVLCRMDTERVVARTAILREANLIFLYALPMMTLETPEERLLLDVFGCDSVIDVKGTTPPVSAVSQPRCDTHHSPLSRLQDIFKEIGSSNIHSLHHSNVNSNGSNGDSSSSSFNQALDASDLWGDRSMMVWTPSSLAKRWRSLRRLLFTQTKSAFWDTVLEATTTPTPLPADEYEDPREIKTIKLNRIQANIGKLSTLSNGAERMKLSVFGQLHKELKTWSNPAFRRSFVGKGHGGQKRAFKVKFVGEGVNDYGGPYRAVFEQIVDELRCDAVSGGGNKPSDKCLLPLLIPSINRISGAGSNQDKFLLTSSATQPATQLQDVMSFFGKLIGMSTRHHFNMAVDLSALVWRPLVRLPLSRAHLETVDNFTARNLEDVTALGLQLEQQWLNNNSNYNNNNNNSDNKSDNNSDNTTVFSEDYVPEEWTDLSFVAFLPDGSKVPLLPGGEDIRVTLGNWRVYVQATECVRLRESHTMFAAFREGVASVLPVELFPLFTAQELEHLLCGNAVVDIDLLKRCAEYEDLDPASCVVTHFWEVLQEMSDEDKTNFLRFVWARSRMPTSAKEFPTHFKLQRLQGISATQTDTYLPHAQTCFFSLALPTYSSKEILRDKLLYAIKNSPNMDADVRLHTAEGWGDS